MAFIEITNNDAHVLIDDMYRNYVPIHVSTYQVYLPDPQYPEYSIYNPNPFTYTGHAGSMPILAIRADDGSWLPLALSMWRSGNTFYWRFYSRVAADRKAYTIVVLDTVASADLGVGTGLVVVKDALGRVTFDSDRPYMKLLEVIVGNVNSVKTYAGKTVGVIVSSPAMGYARIQSGSLTGVAFAATFPARSGNSIITGPAQFTSLLGEQIAPPAGWGTSAQVGPFVALVVDLTGIA